MILRTILIKLFVCQCRKNYGVKNLRELENGRVVGRCLRCNKRVYGNIIYRNEGEKQQ